MPSYKNARATEDVRRELSDIIRSLKDPRISGLLSIVKLELSNDYSHCKVYISSMDGMEGAKNAVAGLTSAAGLIRREMSSRLRLRRIPQFHFVADDGIAHSAHLTQKLRELGMGSREEDGDDN